MKVRAHVNSIEWPTTHLKFGDKMYAIDNSFLRMGYQNFIHGPFDVSRPFGALPRQNKWMISYIGHVMKMEIKVQLDTGVPKLWINGHYRAQDCFNNVNVATLECQARNRKIEKT